jgi:hypothetical protein
MPKQPERPPEKIQPGSQTEGETHAFPQGIATGLEVELIRALAKPAAELFGKGAQAGLAFINKEGPLISTISASWFKDELYQIGIKIGNLTAHAIYIEDMWVEKPVRNIAFDVCPLEDGRVWKAVKAADRFPILVPPQEMIEFIIRLTDNTDKILSKHKVVELKYNYTLAGGEDVGAPRERNVKVVKAALRAKGPAYGRGSPSFGKV